MSKRLYRRATRYLSRYKRLDRNIHLMLLASSLGGLSYAIFSVIFNLYILSLGIGADVLGRIVGANPLASALAAIPVGLIAERTGHKKSLLAVYVIIGLMRLAQALTTDISLIALTAFVGGLGAAGSFVVQIPFFATHSKEGERNLVFTASTVLQSVSLSIGTLIAGYLPNIMGKVAPDLTTAYRYTIFIAGALSLLAMVPVLLIREQPRATSPKKISLYPYLWGIDRRTVQHAVISLFRGLSLGLVLPFLNLYFIHHLNTSREFYSAVAAAAIVPSIIATTLAPLVASTLGTVNAVTTLRILVAIPRIGMALTTIPWLAAAINLVERAVSRMATPLTFAFAMETADAKRRTATAAWMEVLFVLGMAIAAVVAGSLLAKNDYTTPFYLSAGAMALAGVLNHIFFHSGATKAVETASS